MPHRKLTTMVLMMCVYTHTGMHVCLCLCMSVSVCVGGSYYFLLHLSPESEEADI